MFKAMKSLVSSRINIDKEIELISNNPNADKSKLGELLIMRDKNDKDVCDLTTRLRDLNSISRQNNNSEFPIGKMEQNENKSTFTKSLGELFKESNN